VHSGSVEIVVVSRKDERPAEVRESAGLSGWLPGASLEESFTNTVSGLHSPAESQTLECSGGSLYKIEVV
jgi:hypothetical protein